MMADFCLQCNIDMYFGPHSDFAHFGEQGVVSDDQMIAVLCEGCGPTYVDSKGRCCGVCDVSLHRSDTQGRLSEVYERSIAWLERRSGRLGWYYRLRDRFLGTPWEPGLVHEWRYRWHTILGKSRGSWLTDLDVEEIKNAGPQRREAGEGIDRPSEGEEPGKNGSDSSGLLG